jgi:hypothetical protein
VSDLAARLDAAEAQWLQDADVGELLDGLDSDIRGLDVAIAGAFGQRAQRLRTPANAAPASLKDEQLTLGERLALEYEQLAGIESPASAQAARMNLQVEKLAARMSSGHSPAPGDQRAALDLRWWALGPLPTADRQRLTARRDAALSAL